MKLAGLDHITISQPLMEALSKAEDDEEVVSGLSIFKTIDTDPLPDELKERWSWIIDEAKFRINFTRRENGRAEYKQVQVWSSRYR